MTHYSVLVILPKGTTEENAEAVTAQLLAPYDENIEVEAYEQECYCVNSQALLDAGKQTDAKFGSMDFMRKSFVKPENEADIQPAWEAFIAPRLDALYKYSLEHPMHNKPDPECPECHGSGKRSTTYPCSVWRLVDGTGQEVARYRGDEILPGVRAYSGQRYRLLSHEEQGSGLPLLVLQRMSQEEKQTENAGVTLGIDTEQHIQDHPGSISSAERNTERVVRNMPPSTDDVSRQASVGGPRSSDGESEGAALYELQHGTRTDGGRSDEARGSNRVLEARLIGGARWDWYQPGGRWDGDATADGRNFFQVSELRPDWSAFAIVTPNGEWHEKGKMGWWAIVTDEKKNWPAEMYELASAFPEHNALYLDCHI